jgi:ferredoxin, 2Fe-2S
MTQYKVTFLPEKQVVFANRGEKLLDVALKAGVNVDHACGGSCACSTCHIIIKEGFHTLESPEEEEVEKLQELGKHLSATSRLACQTKIDTDLIVEIPL